MSEADLHIMLVEDNPGDADLLRETLAQVEEQLKITHVESLQQAAEFLKQGGHVDVILLDLGLPDSMGIATLEQANCAAPDLPIIVLTGLEDEAVGIEAVRKGAQDYLVKGQNRPRMLLRAIHHAIERKRLEEALRLESTKLQTVLDAAPVAIWIAHDPECRRITGNAYADETIMDIPRGGNISRSAKPSEAAVTYKAVRNGRELRPEELPAQLAASTGRPMIEQDLDLVFPNGRIVHLLMGALPIFDAYGQVCGSVAAGSDVTPMRRAEKALRELNETLEQRVAERTAVAEQRAQHLRELAAELSQAEHRERTRLAAILHDNLQQLLLAARLRLAGVGRGNEETLRAEVKAVDELLSECLGASRDLTMELSPPILHRGALGEVFQWLGGWFGEKHGLMVTVDAEERLPSVPEHIQVFLFHAVRELLFNTVKHSGMMEAHVSLSSRDDCLTVQVEDRGSGFDPKVVQRNLNHARSFGLFNIEERLEALEGRLEVESTPRGGACFRLIVPVSAAEPLGEQV